MYSREIPPRVLFVMLSFKSNLSLNTHQLPDPVSGGSVIDAISSGISFLPKVDTYSLPRVSAKSGVTSEISGVVWKVLVEWLK